MQKKNKACDMIWYDVIWYIYIYIIKYMVRGVKPAEYCKTGVIKWDFMRLCDITSKWKWAYIYIYNIYNIKIFMSPLIKKYLYKNISSFI